MYAVEGIAAAGQIALHGADIRRLRRALEWISEGKGRFSCDPLTHADNCIADMKQVALDALAGREFKEP